MIRSRADYRLYLEADKRALRIDHARPRLVRDETWRFQHLLREVEFYKNCRRGFWWRPYYLYLRWRYKQLSWRYGFTIPPNVFGPALSISHRGTIVVSDQARVGAN